MDWMTPQLVQNEFITQINGISVTIKREDQLHPYISGNKFRKLRYNFDAFKTNQVAGVATFGGAYSNHLVAIAAAGKQFNIPTLGFVRGEELANKPFNPSLTFCKSQGMELLFLSREDYRKKEKALRVITQLSNNAYALLPEGGTNILAIKGCREILTASDEMFDTVAVAVGTGGTYIGLSQSCTAQQQLLGFKAVNDPKVDALIKQQVPKEVSNTLVDDYIFGGYGKVPDQLVRFINDFYQTHQILLDPTYTGKMLFGIFALIKNNAWRWGKNVLVIHTGGIQAIEGFNQRQKEKNRPCIQV